MQQRIPRHTPLWAGADEAGDLTQPGTFGMPPTAAECGTEIGADFADASAEHASLLTHCIGWLVALVAWVIGLAAGQSLADIGWLSTPWAMALGAAWLLVCIGMQRGTVHAIQQW